MTVPDNDTADRTEQAEERTRQTQSFMRSVRRATRRRYTPADVLGDRRDETLRRRREVKGRTINRRRLSNHALRERLAPA